MGSETDSGEKDYASYRLLVDLWAGENPVKTAKLLVLLATNALLIAAMALAGGPVPGNWPICLAGAGFSLVWALSLGRTVLFQDLWRLKIREIAARHPADARFQVLDTRGEREKAPVLLRMMGAIPSAYYLLGTPLLLLILWLGALAFLLL